MDIRLFLDILKIDSTSGKEEMLSEFLSEQFSTPANKVHRFDNHNLLD